MILLRLKKFQKNVLNNIPHIKFVKEKSLDYVDVQSNLRLLSCTMKHFQSISGFFVSPFSPGSYHIERRLRNYIHPRIDVRGI